MPVSRDLAGLAGLAAAALVLMMAGPGMATDLARRMQVFLARPHDLSATLAAQGAVLAWARSVAPLALAALAAGAAAVLLQTGFLFNLSGLAPDFGRLDPRRGLARLFSLVERLGKSRDHRRAPLHAQCPCAPRLRLIVHLAPSHDDGGSLIVTTPDSQPFRLLE